MKNERIYKLTMTGLMAALSYVVFTFLQVKITLPGGDATSIHLGNAVCVLGALLLGSVYGGLGGAIGMTIGDLFDPVYVIYAPKTFILKFCIGLITGLIAHKFGKISTSNDTRHIFRFTLLAATCGMLFNVIFDPLLGYFYKLAIVGEPAAKVALVWNISATSINAVLSVVVSVIIYMALRPALRNAHLLPTIEKRT
jgi:uncharacterized membrane protein